MPALRYDPARLVPLRASASRAVRHLLLLGSDDPAAASALRVAAAVRTNLEQRWLPAIDRLVASDAMLAWTTAAAPWTAGLSGVPLGRELADRAAAVAEDTDPRHVDELRAALDAAATDEEAMKAFFAALGPDALLELVVVLGTVDTGSLELPLTLRAHLAATAQRGDLPHDFARGLVAAAVGERERAGPSGDGGLALSFLVHGGDLPAGFLLAAVDQAIAQEIGFAAASGHDRSAGWTLWMPGGWPQARGLRTEFASPDAGTGDLDWYAAQDPMYALLGQLARDGTAGRTAFTDPDRARYLFAERHLLGDGGRAITMAAATAAAGPDVGPTASAAVRTDAAFVASAFVNHFGRDHAPAVGREEAASVAVARIIAVHVRGVEHALAWSDGGDDDADTVASARVIHVTHQVFDDGPLPTALFDALAVGNVIDLAARTDAGTGVLRGGLADHQHALASAGATRVASGEVAADDAEAFLAEAMQDAARLEGRFAEHVGHEAERRGRDIDHVRSRWVGLIGEGAEQAGRVLGPAGAVVAETVVEPAEALARDALAGAGDRARVESEELAALAGQQLAYVWFRELHDAGVIRTALPANLLTGGRLPSFAELAVRLATDDDGDPSSGWTVGAVLQALDDAPGGPVDLDGRALVDAMKDVQQDAYEPLSD